MYKCVNKCNFNRLVCISPETIARDLGAIIVLITTVLKILDSVKYFYLPNVSAPHTECVIKRKNRRLCSSRFM